METLQQRAMDLRYWLVVLAAVVLVTSAGAPPAFSAVAAGHRVHDIRFLIDGSGSMQVNDPDNRRGAALRLIAGIMPGDVRSGIWEFDQQARNLVPVADTDSDWRRAVTDASAMLNGTGVAANLEDAIRVATQDWITPDPRFERHLIVLFDGYIDISGSEAEGATSRQRVLQDVTGSLADAEVTVHAIGLSGGADLQLLRAISAATNGRFESAENASVLERVFTRILTTIIRPNTIPPQNNEVLVDSSVRELTLLSFRRSKNDQLILVDSNGKEIEIDNLPSNMAWRREASFELISIRQPARGIWKMIGGVDPDNLVIADSSLEIAVSGLTNNLFAQENIVLLANILKNNKSVLDKEFLQTVGVTVTHTVNGEPRQHATLFDDGMNGDQKAGDGIFTMNIPGPTGAGNHLFTIGANGVGFLRMQRRYAAAHALPVMATLALDRSAAPGTYHVSVVPYQALIVPDSMQVTAAVTGSDATRTLLEIKRVGTWLWQGTLAGMADHGRQEISLTISGRNLRQNKVNVELEPLVFEGTRVLVPEVFAVRQRQPVVPAAVRNSSSMSEAVSEYVEFEDVGWMTVLLQVLLMNLLVAGAGYGGFRIWRKRTRLSGSVREAVVSPAAGESEPVIDAKRDSEPAGEVQAEAP